MIVRRGARASKMSISNIQERAHISSTCAPPRRAQPRSTTRVRIEGHTPGHCRARIKECMPFRQAHPMPKSARILRRNQEAQLGARVKEHAYGCHEVCTKEWVPFRRAHLISRSMHSQQVLISQVRATPKAHIGVHAKEHVLGHQDAHNRGAHIEKCTPWERNAHMLRSQCTRPGTTMRSPWANRTRTPRAHRTHAPRCCVQHVHPGCNTCI